MESRVEWSPPQKIDWPLWTWRDSSWWFTTSGLLIAIAIVLYPSLIAYQLWLRLFILFVFVAVSPILILASFFCIKVIVAGIGRMRSYQNLYQIADFRTQEVIRAQQIILTLYQRISGAKILCIEKVLLYGQDVYILLKKKKGAKLRVGERITVIDISVGSPMGIFEITKVEQTVCTARNQGFISPVWSGFIHQAGKTDLPAPPDTCAIYLPKDGNSDE